MSGQVQTSNKKLNSTSLVEKKRDYNQSVRTWTGCSSCSKAFSSVTLLLRHHLFMNVSAQQLLARLVISWNYSRPANNWKKLFKQISNQNLSQQCARSANNQKLSICMNRNLDQQAINKILIRKNKNLDQQQLKFHEMNQISNISMMMLIFRNYIDRDSLSHSLYEPAFGWPIQAMSTLCTWKTCWSRKKKSRTAQKRTRWRIAWRTTTISAVLIWTKEKKKKKELVLRAVQ